MNLHRGQGLDLYWRETLECPSEEDYLEMVNNSMYIKHIIFPAVFFSLHC